MKIRFIVEQELVIISVIVHANQGKRYVYRKEFERLMIGCLIIHGYTGGPHELDPLVCFLKEQTDWDIVVPILPGHGKELALDQTSHEEWLETAEKNLQTLKEKYQTVYVIGFSMGGMIAAYLAAKYEVDKLVLLAPAGKFISLKQWTVDIAEALIDRFKGKINDNQLYIQFKEKAGTVPIRANFEFIKLVMYTRKYLEKVEIPVLIAQGQRDRMVPAKTVYFLDKKIASKQKQLVLFDRSRHQLCLGDDKDTLNQIVYDFLLAEKVNQ